jgi:N-acetylglucosamine malate deacetylase 1
MDAKPCMVAVAAHAADMEFSAGATLLKHALAGWDVHILQLTLGEKGSATLSTAEYGAQKQREALAAADILGCACHFLPYADGELAATDEVAREVATWFRRLRPRVAIAHWPGSIHADHTAAHHIVERATFLSAIRHFDLDGLPASGGIRTYYADNWEDPDGFEPYVYVDVSDAMDRWREAFHCFAIGRGEGGFPYWDWYEARTRLHGIRLGVRHAEAFAIADRGKLAVRELL